MSALIEQTKDRDKKPELIIHVRDLKFTKEFPQTVKDAGMKTNPLPKESPNLNGRCKRFIGTIRWERLDKFLVFGKRHLDCIVSGIVEYYNTKREHMKRDLLPPLRVMPEKVPTLTMDQIEMKEYVGRLVKCFERKAA